MARDQSEKCAACAQALMVDGRDVVRGVLRRLLIES
jgi:hypothetical protein